jgi:hypothetical protein
LKKTHRVGAVVAAPPTPSPASMRGERGGDEVSVASGGGRAVGGGSWPAVGEAARGEEDVIVVGKRGSGARGGGRRSAGRPQTMARRWSTGERAAP